MGCAVDGYKIKANALSGLWAECISIVNQLGTMQSVDLVTVNDMLREVDVNDFLPKRAKRGGSYRGLEQEAAMSTSLGSKSKAKRDPTNVLWHCCKQKGHFATKRPTKSNPWTTSLILHRSTLSRSLSSYIYACT